MSDWDPSNGGPPRIGHKSGEAAALGFVRAIVNWFGSLDSLTVVFGTCALTCAGVFLLMQFSSRKEAPPAASGGGGGVFSEAPSSEPQLPEVHMRGPRDRMLSALDFVPKMPENQPASPKEEAKPAGAPAEPKAPAIPAIASVVPAAKPNPQAAAAAALAGMKMPGGAGAGGGGGVAAGARIGTPQPDAAASAGSSPGKLSGALGPSAGAAEGGDSELARKLLPLVKLYSQGTTLQKYGGTASHNYAVDFGKAVMERQLNISTSTVVTAKDAHALVEGLGIHIPKAKN